MRKTLFIFLSTFLLSCNDVVNLNENSHQKENKNHEVIWLLSAIPLNFHPFNGIC